MRYETNAPQQTFRCAKRFNPKEKNTAQLLKIIGLERFLQLQDIFGGRRIRIPKRRTMWPCGLCSVRDRCIRGWHRQGIQAKTIAHYLKISPDTVNRIVRTDPLAGRDN